MFVDKYTETAILGVGMRVWQRPVGRFWGEKYGVDDCGSIRWRRLVRRRLRVLYVRTLH